MTRAGSVTEYQPQGLSKRLLNAFDTLPCLANTTTLRQIVTKFGQDSKAALDEFSGPPRRQIIFQLLEELMPDPARLIELVQELDVREGGSAAIRRLRLVTAAWEVDLLDDEEWDELLTMLDGVQVDFLHRRYSDYLLTIGHRVAPPLCTEPWAVFLHAATLNARPGRGLPCFDVLKHILALGAEGELQMKIVEWAERRNPVSSELSSCDEPQLSAQTPTGGWAPADYLIIQIKPLVDLSSTGNDALLSHWWRLHPGEQRRGTDRRISIGIAEAAVRDLIWEAEDGWAHFRKSDLAVEFLLPRELFHFDVGQWRKKAFQGAEGVLGEDHHVVVRSLDRLARRDLHGRWARRWDAFVLGTAGRVHMFAEHKRSDLLAEPPPAVAVLSAPPTSLASEDQLDEIAEALRAGVPVVLWDRRDGLDPAFREALTRLFNEHDLRELPNLIRMMRVSSGNTTGVEAILGRYLAVLWDDPTRIPVDYGETFEGLTA